ncbi:hypothetical protein H5410_051439 [Solanum commersonii]|uniref:Uncharacterized protein n=1 Tax=Solanum commersonii TaxID=4109 RepID=A0A9J5X0J4_SOLCO|nr:hypothetical protein H5410_051439 [Solanum commersonii]
MHNFTHRFCLYFPIDICFSSLKIEKVFSRLVMGLSAEVWSFRLNGYSSHEMCASAAVCTWASVPRIVLEIWASMPRVTSEGIVVPNIIGVVVDVSVSDVWITGCTTVSTRSGKSLNKLSSWCSIISSLVSTSDSSYAVPSLYTSPVVAGGIFEVSGASSSSTASINKLKSMDFK